MTNITVAPVKNFNTNVGSFEDLKYVCLQFIIFYKYQWSEPYAVCSIGGICFFYTAAV